MSFDIVMLVLSSAAALAAVILLSGPAREPACWQRFEFTETGRRVVIGAGAAVVVLAFTGWVIPSLVAAVAAGLAARA